MRWRETVSGISGPFPGTQKIDELRRGNEDVRDGFEKWDRRVAEVERKIDRFDSLDLDVLAKAGADRNVLVHLLAITASKGNSEWWKELVRRRRDALVSMAKRMETLAALAKRQASDVTFRSSFYTY